MAYDARAAGWKEEERERERQSFSERWQKNGRKKKSPIPRSPFSFTKII